MSPALVAAIPRLVKQESGGQQFGPDGSVLTSPKGARGIFQIMPGTAGDLGINPDDPAQNVQGGIRYLAQMGDRFKDPQLALAAYNAGPGAVQKAGGIPNIRETQDYVQKVGGLPIGSYEVAASGNQASDAYPAVPAASKTAGATASGGASPTEQMTTINDWERYWIGRAMSQPGLSKSGRAQAVDLVRKEAERRRSELKFQNTEAHYRERMDNQERNFRVREEARGITDEMRRAQADMKEQSAALKAEQSAAKDKSSRIARLDAIAGNVSKIVRPETDITTGETKYNTIEDPDMKRRIASSLRNLQAYLNLDELTWQDVANDLADEYKAHLVFYKEQGASPEEAARKAINDAHAIVHEKWRDKTGDEAAKAAGQAKNAADAANKSPGKLESERDAASGIDPDTGLPEAPVTDSTYLKPTASQATGLPVNTASRGDFISSTAAHPAPEPVSSNVNPADVPQAMADEKRYRDQRKGDLRLLRNVGIPTDSRSLGQVVDMLDRAFVRPTKDALTGAASLADTALGLPIREAGRMISDAYERNYGETGHQNDIDMAIQAYEGASSDVRAAMDVQARRKWGVTISELIREHKKSRDKGAD